MNSDEFINNLSSSSIGESGPEPGEILLNFLL